MEEQSIQATQTLEEDIYIVLDNALDIGITENEFWDMTLREIDRRIKSYKRRQKEQLSMNYALANMIGISAAVRISGKGKFPNIETFFPDFFSNQEDNKPIVEVKTKQSINRFKAFAIQHNQKYREANKIDN